MNLEQHKCQGLSPRFRRGVSPPLNVQVLLLHHHSILASGLRSIVLSPLHKSEEIRRRLYRLIFYEDVRVRLR